MTTTELEMFVKGIAALAPLAKELVADAHHGQSPLVGAIRARLTGLEQAVAGHQRWCELNPAPPATTEASNPQA